tara:strand:- start:154 stop:675 length:522 start_codon:yes stop_codon:yes gene_type:complete
MPYKKWIYKYKYLKYEFDETKELRDKYIKDFNSKFTFKDKKEDIVIIPKEDELASPPKKAKNKKVKELYKKLSKKLHPDKGGNEKDFNELNELYETENILEMAIKAEELNIEVKNINEYFTDDSFSSLCYNLEEQTSFIKTTLAWKWAVATEEERKILVQLFEQQHGVVPVKE